MQQQNSTTKLRVTFWSSTPVKHQDIGLLKRNPQAPNDVTRAKTHDT